MDAEKFIGGFRIKYLLGCSMRCILWFPNLNILFDAELLLEVFVCTYTGQRTVCKTNPNLYGGRSKRTYRFRKAHKLKSQGRKNLQKVLRGDTRLITQNIRSYWLALGLCKGQTVKDRSHRTYWPSFTFSKEFPSIIVSEERPPCVLDLPGVMWPWLSNR